MFTKNSAKPVFYGLIFIAALGASATRTWAKDGFPSHGNSGDVATTPLSAANYCNLKFPALRPSTIGTSDPQLKNPNTGDIVDYYGPCDHNPVGKDEMLEQEHEFNRYWETNNDS
jgi:hypothetical protein